jgi:hypothetical protein
VTSNHLEVRVPDGLDVEIGDTATLITAEPGAEPTGVRGRPSPNADILGDWTGLSVYGLLMRLNPLLPRRLV